jgi:hypothetical protein
VVYAWLSLSLLGGHAVKANTEIGEMGFSESIIVSDGPPSIEPPIFTIADSIEIPLSKWLRRGKHDSSDVKIAGMNRNGIRTDGGFLGLIREILWKRMRGDTHASPINCPIGRSLTEIMWGQPNDRLCRRREVTDNLVIGWGDEADVGTQLPVLGVFGDPGLAARENSSRASSYRSDESKDGRNVVNPMLVICAGFPVFCSGFWRMYFTARTGGLRTWTIGGTLFLIGWIACVVAGIWLLIGHSPFVFASTSASAHSENAPVFSGFSGASAPRYRGLEDIGIRSIVVSKLKLRDVQRQVLPADLVEAVHDAALQQRPETIDGLRVHDAVNVLLLGMTDEAVREISFEVPITGMLIGDEQANVIGDRLANEAVQRRGIGIVDNAGDHVALALDCTDGDELASNASSGMFLVPMTVAVAAADISFVNVYESRQA